MTLSIIWFRAVIVLWPFRPPWWFLFIMLFEDRNNSRWPIMYFSMIFSIVHKLLRGLKDPIVYIGLPFLCFGVNGSILKIWGNFLFIIIWVVRWVIRGAMVSTVFLSIFIDMWSCPLSFCFLI